MSIIIIGAGQIGQFIASKLSSENKDVIIVEEDERKISELGEELDVQIIRGNGASPAVLREANINQAQMIIAVTDSDEVNLLACLMSNLQTTAPVTVARVRNPEFYEAQDEEIRKKLNIDLIINPDKVAADAILRVLSVPGSVEVLDFFERKVKIVGIRVKEKSEITHTLLEDLHQNDSQRRFLFSAIIREGHTIIPSGKNKILPGDTVYFVSESDKVDEIMEYFGHKSEKLKRVMIDGGTHIGLYLAKILEKNNVQVKIVEPDPKACSVLVRNLDKTIVLNEFSTDEIFLKQENVGEMDAFISVTKDDENNILSSLLAKRLGAPWTITLTNQISYISLITAIGVDVAISPRLIANSEILHFIRQGKVLSVSALQENVEILEIEALETSDIVNIPLKNAKIPKGALILCVEKKGEIFIPYGDTVIEPGDKVLIQSTTEAIKKVEKLFTVKLEYF